MNSLKQLRALGTAIGLCMLTGAATLEAREVTLTGDPWPPYVNGELGEEAQGGIAVELARRIFDRIEDVSPRFPLIPWARALREVELGNMDGIVMLLKTHERERYMAYTDALLTSRALIWYEVTRHPQGFDWSSIADLEPYTIGVVRGYSYGPEIERAAKSGALRLVEINDVDRMFSMLARGRLDLALANDNVGYGLARKHAGEATLRAAHRATGEDVYHMAFSRKSDAVKLIEKINGVIADLRHEGVIDAISRGD